MGNHKDCQLDECDCGKNDKDKKTFDEMQKMGAILYAKFGHLSKKKREEMGIWFGDGKQ
jgi:hypothetical protein